MEPIYCLLETIGGEEQLCLLPISRVLVEEVIILNDDFIIFPPSYFSGEEFRVVSWPQMEFSKVLKGQKVGLAWFKSGATQITKEEFFSSALVAFKTNIDWDMLLSTEEHVANRGQLPI